MPNHVANYVVITGDVDVLKVFWQKATEKTENNPEEEFSYRNLYPVPPNTDSYFWCIDNWGNKWGCYDIVEKKIEIENGIIELYYDTAWSPSEPFWKKITKKYNIEVTNYFHDEGSIFCGHHIYNNGTVISREEYYKYYENKDIFIRYANMCGRDGWYDKRDDDESDDDKNDENEPNNE
ncbi:hypothetical protein ma354 [Moumouvirus australiensis]|uniref:YubB ferredoxin-like domain-containing protein n=1 Tax=Moumouvirus australiensis TaxID=2109587 RepID=A0A2P1ELI1_9VIRU|nr:hypothetical protein QKC55_gp551 [Moumouvirus australiensis]AVL94740.1 hypothetical protein ma354 [Moumouvirus australiensis]